MTTDPAAGRPVRRLPGWVAILTCLLSALCVLISVVSLLADRPPGPGLWVFGAVLGTVGVGACWAWVRSSAVPR